MLKIDRVNSCLAWFYDHNSPRLSGLSTTCTRSWLMIHKNFSLSLSLSLSKTCKVFVWQKKKKKERKKAIRIPRNKLFRPLSQPPEPFHHGQDTSFQRDLYLTAGSAANSISPPLARKRGRLSINFGQWWSEILTSHCNRVFNTFRCFLHPSRFCFLAFHRNKLQGATFTVQYQQDRRFLANWLKERERGREREREREGGNVCWEFANKAALKFHV